MRNQKLNPFGRIEIVIFLALVFALSALAYGFVFVLGHKIATERQKQEYLDALASDWSFLQDYSEGLDRRLSKIREYKTEIQVPGFSDPALPDMLCQMKKDYNFHASNYNVRMARAYEVFPNLEELLEVARSSPLPRRHELVADCMNKEK